MIQSILDNDQYKFTMQQALLKLGFAAVPVKYKFKCRTEGIDFTHFYHHIQDNIGHLQHLQIDKWELDYLRSIRYFSEEYLGFLKQFRFDLDYVDLRLINDGELDLTISGPWFQTILFEVPLLAIISECYSDENNDYQQNAYNKLVRKTQDLPIGFEFADFGTRRRRSYIWHREVVAHCKSKCPSNFIGTSNMFLAANTDVRPIGTMAHEWLQAHQQLGYRLADSQKMALENWIKVYRGDLGIALSDVINTDAFLKDFNDPFFYKLFDGVREDSEPDPMDFARRVYDFYHERNIDPVLKTIVFSNGLNMEKAVKIYGQCYGHIGCSFGIGTNLTNDWDTKPLNIVIKMVECNHQPVAKVSNSPGKGMCESDEFVSYLKSVFNLEHN